MTIKDIFRVCSICPGLCRLDCPVYISTRDIRSAPDRLGLAGYFIVERGDTELIYNLELCTGCGYCREACPVNNDLPHAIFKTRTLVPEISRELKIEEYGEVELEENKLYLAINKLVVDLDEDKLSKLGIEVLDTSDIYRFVSYGYRVTIKGSGKIISEDIDVFRPDGELIISSLEYEWPKYSIGSYILHIPCKLREKWEYLVKLASEKYGKPSKVIVGCSGGGGYFYNNYPELTTLIVKRLLRRVRLKVLTLCIYSWRAMKNLNIDAYTPAIIFMGGG